MFEGWFKTEKEDEFKKRTLEEQDQVEEEKRKLQNLVDSTITNQQKFFELTDKKFEASQTPDDQELNVAGMANVLNKELEEYPLLAHEMEEKAIKNSPNIKDGAIDSNYVTKN
jgi:hypothetical protein